MRISRSFIAFTLVMFSVAGMLLLKKLAYVGSNRAQYTIGILQTASHPALDAAREGFVSIIKERLGSEVEIVVRNGEGSVNTLYTAAQHFHARSDIDAIFAIATPAAQAITSLEHTKPIIISAVSVSPELGITFDAANVAGVSDMIDVKGEIEAMKALLPAINTVGILFTAAETNSVATSKIMARELEKVGLVPYIIGIASEADIESALTSALRKVDAVLAPTDTPVASAINLIATIMRNAQKPLILSDNMLVKYGALMARGVDYYESGKQAGDIALDIVINHRSPREISIIAADSKDIFINKHVMQALQIVIPESLMSYIHMVDSVQSAQ